jgi:excisionase family DNA binding protein
MLLYSYAHLNTCRCVEYTKERAHLNTMLDEKIYKVAEVAKILRVDPRTVRKMIADKEIEAFKVRDEYRIRQGALDAYIRRRDT